MIEAHPRAVLARFLHPFVREFKNPLQMIGVAADMQDGSGDAPDALHGARFVRIPAHDFDVLVLDLVALARRRGAGIDAEKFVRSAFDRHPGGESRLGSDLQYHLAAVADADDADRLLVYIRQCLDVPEYRDQVVGIERRRRLQRAPLAAYVIRQVTRARGVLVQMRNLVAVIDEDDDVTAADHRVLHGREPFDLFLDVRHAATAVAAAHHDNGKGPVARRLAHRDRHVNLVARQRKGEVQRKCGALDRLGDHVPV